MNTPILGYWIETKEQIYFVRGPQDALPEHKSAFKGNVTGVTVTVVTRHIDIAQYVILKDKKHKYEGTDIRYSRWSPMSPVPLEHDHLGEERYVVLDFAETIEEAEAICKQLRSKK